MTPASPFHKLFLITAGLFLGILLYLFYFVGGFLTLAGFLVERATQPLPQAEALEETNTIQQELLGFLNSLEFGNITMIGEESLDHAISAMAALKQGQDNPNNAVAIEGIHIDLEPGEIQIYTDLVMTLPESEPSGRIRLRPFSMKVRTDFQVHPEEDEIILSLTGISLSRLSLPDRIAEGIFAALIPENAGLPFTRISRTAFSLPYSLLQQALPPVLQLDNLEVRKDALAANIRIDRGLRETILANLSTLVRKEGAAFAEAVTAAFPSTEKALEDAVLRLAGTAEPKSLIPSMPSALISHINGQVAVLNPGKEHLRPVTGGDIFEETIIQTGSSSSMELILRDGTMLKIGEDTRFTLAELPEGTDQPAARFVLEEGTVRGQIPRDNTPDYRFATPSAEYRVTGTDLIIEVQKQQTRLSVLQGSVACQPEKRPVSAVLEEQQLTAARKDLSRRDPEPLLPVALQLSEKKRLESLMVLLTAPEDGVEIRETTRFWESLNAFKDVTSRIISLDEESRARLGEELEKRVDPEVIDRRFMGMMKNPDFAALINSYGIEGIPNP